MKIISIVGARPQFIKVAALHNAILKKDNVQHLILHTNQHYDYDLSEIFFNDLDIPKPSFYLDIADASTASSIKQMQPAIEKILSQEKPDVVIVFGDTNSTLAGALAAKKLDIKLAHVEAGLRSFNNLMPEEYNRIETDKISDLLFCPTTAAVNNLSKEQFINADKKIILSGDIMFDAFNFYSKTVSQQKLFYKEKIQAPFILCTLHRQHLVQSTQKLTEIVKALNYINTLTPLLLPAHPAFRKSLRELGLQINFIITEPAGYLEMLSLLKNCKAVITDSGGLQKEAFFSKKICITLRDETEWTELVKANVNFLAGDSSSEKITVTYNKAHNAKGNFTERFYGDGNAGEIIVNNIIDHLSAIKERAAL